MSVELLINDVDYACYMERKSLVVTESNRANGQTAQFTLVIGDGEAVTRPYGGQHIVLSINGTRHFAGRLSSISQYHDMLLYNMKYDVDCIDYTADLDNHLIQDTYPVQNAGDIIRDIVGDVGRGFTSNNVMDGPTLGPIESDLEYPSALITRLAESVEHQWYVDYFRDVHFFYILARPAPVGEINLDTDTANYFDAELTEHVDQVKNVIYLSGASAKSGTQDQINMAGDGDTRFIPLNYEPWDMESITVTVDGVPQEILLDTVDGQAGDGKGEAGQVYLCLDNWGVRFPDDHPPGAPEGGEPNEKNVGVGYNYAYDPIIKVEDPASIALMRSRENASGAPSDGIHEFKFEIPDLRVESENAIIDYGNLLLARYAFPYSQVTFSSWTQGWQAGQFFRAYSVARDFDSVVYIQSIRKTLLETRESGTTRLRYDIEGSTLPFPS